MRRELDTHPAVLYTWATAGYHRALRRVQLFGATVPGDIVDIRCFLSLKKQETVFQAGPAPLRLDGVHETARDRSSEVDEAIRFLCYSMLKNISEPILNSSLYGLFDEWPKRNKFHSQRGRLPLVFAIFSDSVCQGSESRSTATPQLEVTEFYQDGNDVIRSGRKEGNHLCIKSGLCCSLRPDRPSRD